MKLNIDTLYSKTEESIFDKGLAIYLENTNLTSSLSCINQGDEYRYSITIPKTLKQAQQVVKVKIVKENNDYVVGGYLCHCLYCKNSKKMCEHVVFILLLIMENLEFGLENFQKYLDLYATKTKLDDIKKISLKTENLNVELIPSFIIEDGLIHLRVHIKDKATYIIYSIPNFLNSVNNDEFFSYGKNLEFTHNILNFNEKAQKLIMLLQTIKIEFNKKNIVIKSETLLMILRIYQNDIINFKINNVNFETLNTLDNKLIEIHASNNYLTIEKEQNLTLIEVLGNYLMIDHNSISFAELTRAETQLVKLLIKNNYFYDITSIKDQFFIEAYHNVKRLIVLDDELKNQFELHDVKIESYIDLVDRKLKLTPRFYEDNVETNFDDLAILSKALIIDYEKTLKTFNFSIPNYEIRNAEKIQEFIHKDISEIKVFGDVYFTQKLKNLTTKKMPGFIINPVFNTNILQVQIESDLSENEIEAILNAYRNKEKYVILDNDSIVELTNETKELNRVVLQYDLEINNLKQLKTIPLYNIMNLVKENLTNSENLENFINDLKDYDKLEIYPIPKLNNALRSYQLTAFKWLSILAKYQFGGLLADEMGLGKSLEILSLILSDKSEKPSIIISPTSLVYNWVNEIKKWDESAKTEVIIGTSEKRKELINNIKTDEKIIYVISYDLLKRDIEEFNTYFKFIIIDEAQYIKNTTTKVSKAVKSLTAEVRFALTGTPIENSIDDLFSIFEFLLPNYLNDFKQFKDENLESDDKVIEYLNRKVSPFILRRTKKEVLTELPEKIENVYYTKIAEEQRRLYDSYLSKIRKSINNKSEIEVLSLLTRLRQICVSPRLFLENYQGEEVKIDLVIDIIAKAIESKKKILLFSQFTQAFELLEEKLNEKNIVYFKLTGKTKTAERINLTEQFNNKEDSALFLISLKAGGTGLNLHTADTIIHLDPWWNQAAEAQANDRAHRMGQTKVVNIIKLIVDNTIEEKVLKLQEIKGELTKKIIDKNQMKKLNYQELKNMLLE